MTQYAGKPGEGIIITGYQCSQCNTELTYDTYIKVDGITYCEEHSPLMKKKTKPRKKSKPPKDPREDSKTILKQRTHNAKVGILPDSTQDSTTHKPRKGKRVNQLRKMRLKNELLKGETNKQAMINAGYSPNTAQSVTNRAVMQKVLKVIEEDFKLSDITVEKVLKDIEYGKDKALTKADINTYMRGCELEGKYLAIFKDNLNVNDTKHTNINLNHIIKDRIKPLLPAKPDHTPTNQEITPPEAKEQGIEDSDTKA